MCGLCLHYLQKGFPADASSSGWLEQSIAMAMVIAMCWSEKQPTLCCTYVLISKENNTRDACVTVCGLRRPEFNEWVHYSISALNNDPHHTNRTPPRLQWYAQKRTSFPLDIYQSLSIYALITIKIVRVWIGKNDFLHTLSMSKININTNPQRIFQHHSLPDFILPSTLK